MTGAGPLATISARREALRAELAAAEKRCGQLRTQIQHLTARLPRKLGGQGPTAIVFRALRAAPGQRMTFAEVRALFTDGRPVATISTTLRRQVRLGRIARDGRPGAYVYALVPDEVAA